MILLITPHHTTTHHTSVHHTRADHTPQSNVWSVRNCGVWEQWCPALPSPVSTDGRLPELRAPTDVCSSEAQSASSSRGVNRTTTRRPGVNLILPAHHFMSQHFSDSIDLYDPNYYDFYHFLFLDQKTAEFRTLLCFKVEIFALQTLNMESEMGVRLWDCESDDISWYDPESNMLTVEDFKCCKNWPKNWRLNILSDIAQYSRHF